MIDRRRQPQILQPQPAVQERGRQAHAQERGGDAGDRDGQQAGRERGRIDRARRIGNDLDRPHGGEVMGHDRQREQERGEQSRARAGATRRNRQGRNSQQHSERNGSRDQQRVPADAAGHVDRRNAGIVHAGDAGPDDGAADRRPPRRRTIDRGRKPQGRDCDRCDQREHGQPHVIGHPDAGIVSQHRDEMRRPDAAAGRAAGRDDPVQAGDLCRRPSVVKEVDGDQARKKADDAGHDDEAPVVLGGEAGEDTIHGGLRWLEELHRPRGLRRDNGIRPDRKLKSGSIEPDRYVVEINLSGHPLVWG